MYSITDRSYLFSSVIFSPSLCLFTLVCICRYFIIFLPWSRRSITSSGGASCLCLSNQTDRYLSAIFVIDLLKPKFCLSFDQSKNLYFLIKNNLFKYFLFLVMNSVNSSHREIPSSMSLRETHIVSLVFSSHYYLLTISHFSMISMVYRTRTSLNYYRLKLLIMYVELINE
jgi:hypothetical protein